jgi:hypothetical protein
VTATITVLTYRELDVNVLLLFSELLGSGNKLFQVLVCSLVVLFDLNRRGVVDGMKRLSLLHCGLVGVGQDALEVARYIGEAADSILRSRGATS